MVKMATTEETPVKNLKHLGFVNKAATTAYSASALAERVYKGARAYTPAVAEPYVAKTEDTVLAYTAPVVAKAQDTGDKVLHFADDQVDLVLTTASKGLASVREMHETNLRSFNAATEKYFNYMKSTADWIADHVNPEKNVQAARDTLQAALATAREMADPDKAVDHAWKAWNSFASVPAVHKVLDTAEPVVKKGQETFEKLHDSLVAAPLYKKAVETGSSTINWISVSTPYRLGAQYLYPWVAPVADPALANLSNSAYVNKALTYWKPTVVA